MTLLLTVLTASACTINPLAAGSGGPAAVPGNGSLPPVSAPAAASGGAFWQDTVNFTGTGPEARPVQVRVYPLQRLRDRVLLTVDLTAALSTTAFDPFCTGTSCGDLSGVSLINTATRTRFGPLRSGQSGPLMTSSTIGLALAAGMTYRFGAVFADPGANAVVVDLQQAGLAMAVPAATSYPAANLISTQSLGPARWNPAPVTVGTTVTAPLPALNGVFDQNQHALIAKIVGGTVNDGPGMVTISSDAIFQMNTATLSARGPARIQRAADLLSARADPAQPIAITGYTDSTGGPALSGQQARAVSAALAKRVKQYTLIPRGLGKTGPVAAGTTSMGQASPAGRALNRRIELSYTPRAGAPGTMSPAPSPTTSVTSPNLSDPSDPSVQPSPNLSATSDPSVQPSPDLSAQPSPNLTATSDPSVQPSPDLSAQTSPDPRLSPSSGATSAVGDGLATAGPARIDPHSKAAFTATVTQVKVDGGMTVVGLVLQSDLDASVVDAFSTRTGRRTNLSAFHLIDPATGQVFIPAYDTGNPDRVTGTFAYRFEGGMRYALSFLTTALPAGITTVDVALAGIGTAKGAEVER